jgi:phosphatidate cytidylyltransferase
MERLIYSIILAYFILGGIGFYLVNRNKAPEIARKSYTKFGVYFIIINVLFFSIVIDGLAFRYLSVLIIVTGLCELTKLFRTGGFKQSTVFGSSLLVYAILAIGFYLFSGFEKELVLFSFLIVSIFDSFSQISGQLFGKTKIIPNVSPNKTLEGLIGGTLISLISAFLLKSLFPGTIQELFLFTIGTVVFAFAGDILASLYKRKFEVKDYSNWIPGHGGFLDRFDSLIAGGAWAALAITVLGI